MRLAQITLIAGLITVSLTILALIMAIFNIYEWHLLAGLSRQGFILMCLLELAVASFLSYASSLKIKQADIAEKFYPSSIAAQILLALMWRYAMVSA